MATLSLSYCTGLTGVGLNWIATACPFLQSLNISYCTNIDDRGLRAINGLSQLTSLNVDGCTQISDTGMIFCLLGDDHLSSDIQSLEHLSMADCPALGNDSLQALASSPNAKTLLHLDCRKIDNCLSTTLVSLFRRTKNLVSIRFEDQAGADYAVVSTLSKSCRALTILDVTGCEHINDYAASQLRGMRNLRTLVLSKCPHITDAAFRHFPLSLEHIECRYWSQMTNDMIQALVANFTPKSASARTLQSLDVSFAPQLTMDGILSNVDAGFLHGLNVYGCENIRQDLLRQHQPPNVHLVLGDAAAGEEISGWFTRPVTFLHSVKHGTAASQRSTFSTLTLALEAFAAEQSRQKHVFSMQQEYFAARKIQFQYRLNFGKLPFQYSRESATVMIQKHWRGYTCRQDVKTMRQKLVTSTIYVQYRFRKYRKHKRHFRALNFWKNRSVSMCLKHWKHHRLLCALEREEELRANAGLKAVQFWKDRRTIVIFSSWKTWALENQGQRKRALHHWKYRSMPKYFDHWKERIKSRWTYRQFIVSIFMTTVPLSSWNAIRQQPPIIKATRFNLKLYVKHWREQAAIEKKMCQQQLLSMLSNRTEVWSFRTWKRRVDEQKDHKAKCAQMFRKIVHRQSYACFQTWQELVAKSKTKKRALVYFTNLCRTRCFNSWKLFVSDAQDQKRRMQRIMKRMIDHQIVSTIQYWHSLARERRIVKLKIKRSLAHLFRAGLVRCFNAWHGYTDHVVNIQKKLRLRLSDHTVESVFEQWKQFLWHRQWQHYAATKIQALWRGQLGREMAETTYYYTIWATMFLQSNWRGRAARKLAWRFQRKIFLKEYKRAEGEQEQALAAEAEMHFYECQLKSISLIQRLWRGKRGRSFFFEWKRQKYLEQKRVESEDRQRVILEAQAKEQERKRVLEIRALAIVTIQRHWKGYLARVWYAQQQEHLQKVRIITRIQANYRGLRERRYACAKRRNQLTKVELLARRSAEAVVLHKFQAKTRESQIVLRGLFNIFGLNPSSFVLNARTILSETMSDMKWIRFLVQSSILQARIDHAPKGKGSEKNAAVHAPVPISTTPTVSLSKEIAVAALSDRSNSISSMTSGGYGEKVEDEHLEAEHQIGRGDAVRIILPGHRYFGQTAYVIGIDKCPPPPFSPGVLVVKSDISKVSNSDFLLEILLDQDQVVEYLPYKTPDDEKGSGKPLFTRISRMEFTIIPQVCPTAAWRQNAVDYAESLREQVRLYASARVIQCCARVYLARVRYHEELEFQGCKNAQRQKKLLKILNMLGLANYRTADLLRQMRVITSADIPLGGELKDEPLKIMKFVDRFTRSFAMRAEIEQAFATLAPEKYAGEKLGDLAGEWMEIRFDTVIESFIFRPLKVIRKVLTHRAAQRLEAQGHQSLAWFLGGAEYIRSFEENQTWVKVWKFQQLAKSSYTKSDGHVILHGIFDTKGRPHGWGVAKFLTGQSYLGKIWSTHGSVEARYKALSVIRQFKQQERDQILAAQIRARQAAWNDRKTKEGPRGYALRHEKLSLIEDQLDIKWKRYVEEHEMEIQEREECLRVERDLMRELHELNERWLKVAKTICEIQIDKPEVPLGLEISLPVYYNPLEILTVGSKIDICYAPYSNEDSDDDDSEDPEDDPDNWLTGTILSIDAYDREEAGGGTARIMLSGDHSIEEIALVREKATEEISFYPWKAGSLYACEWTAADDHGAMIKKYVLEYEIPDVLPPQRQFVKSQKDGTNVDGNHPCTTPPDTKVLLWPLEPLRSSDEELMDEVEEEMMEQASSASKAHYSIRICAENKVGEGMFSNPIEIHDQPYELHWKKAKLLQLDDQREFRNEQREVKEMYEEDDIIQQERASQRCHLCHVLFESKGGLNEHIAQSHGIALLCPFQHCQQPTGSIRSLRYHIDHCSELKCTTLEQHNQTFMDIYAISPNYHFTKKRRHYLPDESHLALDGEAFYFESKIKSAIEHWYARSRKFQEHLVAFEQQWKDRDTWSVYRPPTSVYGIDYEDISKTVDLIRRSSEDLKETREIFRAERQIAEHSLVKLIKQEQDLNHYIELKTKKLTKSASQEKWVTQSLQRDRAKAQKQLRKTTEDIDTSREELDVLVSTFEHTQDRLCRLIAAASAFEKLFGDIRVKREQLTEQHETTISVVQPNTLRVKHRRNAVLYGMQQHQDQVDVLLQHQREEAQRQAELTKLHAQLRRARLENESEAMADWKAREEESEGFELKLLRQEQRQILRQAIENEQNNERRMDYDAPQVSSESLAQLQIAIPDPMVHSRYLEGMAKDRQNVWEEGELEKMEQEMSRQALRKRNQEKFKPRKPTRTTKREASLESKTQHEEGHNLKMIGPLVEPTQYRRLECEFNEGWITGNVRVEYNDGSLYEGLWVEDLTCDVPVKSRATQHQVEPWGKFTTREGIVWEGAEVNNYFNPKLACGSFLVTNPEVSTVYDGQILQGQYHGYGVLSMNGGLIPGKYIGEWKAGLRYGHGIEIFDDGEKYEGSWEHDLYHDPRGHIWYEDGSEYHGSFECGEFHGPGVRTLLVGSTSGNTIREEDPVDSEAQVLTEKITGTFEYGLLHSHGTSVFSDGAFYDGMYRNTLRHGKGSYTFPNGDRYEGPFESNEPHGEGILHTRSNGEHITRVGRWTQGHLTQWLTSLNTKTSTMTFIQYFGQLVDAPGGMRFELMKKKFKTPYAVMIASRLPHLPDGVDYDDVCVQTIIHQLARSQNEVIGSEVLENTEDELTKTVKVVEKKQQLLRRLVQDLDAYEMNLRRQKKVELDVALDLELALEREAEIQRKVEHFWKHDPRQCEMQYKKAVAELNHVEAVDWYQLRKARPEKLVGSLLEAFAMLLNFTPNHKLRENIPIPSKDDLMKLLANNDENVVLGDKEGLIHVYNIKALYIIPLFDIYSFAEGTRHGMLQHIAPVIHNPRLRPNNLRLAQISLAAPAICAWTRAAFFYTQTACEIYPTHQRLTEQYAVIEMQKAIVAKERNIRHDLEHTIERTSTQISTLQLEIDAKTRDMYRLERVLEDIKQIDRLEHEAQVELPILKTNVEMGSVLELNDDDHDERELTFEQQEEKDGQEQTVQHLKPHERPPSTTTNDNNNNTGEPEPTQDPDSEPTKLSTTISPEEGRVDFRRLLARDGSGNASVLQELDRIGVEVQQLIIQHSSNFHLNLGDIPKLYAQVYHKPFELHKTFGIKKVKVFLQQFPHLFQLKDLEPTIENGGVRTEQPEPQVTVILSDAEWDKVLLPPLAFPCRLCPGLSYADENKLEAHQHTRWHAKNVERANAKEDLQTYSRKALMWNEEMDNLGNVSYVNQLTKETSVYRPDEMDVDMVDLTRKWEIPQATPVDSVQDQEEPLEYGWTEHVDISTGELYYFHAETQESTFEKPIQDYESQAPLLPGWSEYWDESNEQMYYYDEATQETTYERPIASIQDGWEEVYDETHGQSYLFHPGTGETKWQ